MRVRRNVKIRGVVQGIGFRETVRRIASRYDVHGFVRNAGSNVVEIEAEGDPEVVNAFLDDVLAHPPGIARIDDVHSTQIPPTDADGFFVERSIR
jgi:hydrogenase maturation factor HypF (carbamoyltransferase family)